MMTEQPLSQELLEQLDGIADIAAQAQRIAVLTGAGVSAESGIPTFRDAQTGLWEKHDPVMLASIEGFHEDPALVWKWYDERRQTMKQVEPNPGHYALAAWEAAWREMGRGFQLITQNIDDLHGRAGSRDIIELHGNIWYVRALEAGIDEAFLLEECPLPEHPPRDDEGRILRPHVVWFGEQLDPLKIQAAFDAASACDLCIVAGTSAVVFPAAAVPYEAKRNAATLIEINPNATELTRAATFALAVPSGAALPELWRRVQQRLAGRPDEAGA
jgi:NAD-dependent deacetylase